MVAVLALALGIGANSAIWSVVYGVLLRPLPYPEADLVLAGVALWASFLPAHRAARTDPQVALRYE